MMKNKTGAKGIQWAMAPAIFLLGGLLSQAHGVTVIPMAQTNVACYGGSSGSATVAASGIGPLTYLWSPSGGTAPTAIGLAAGSYTVTVTDSDSSSVTRNFAITQPSALLATSSQTNVSSFGGADGSASVAASGGVGGYTYSWWPSGGTAATATGLMAGSYTVTIMDANTCSRTQSFTITQPAVVAPVAIGDSYSTPFNTALTVTAPGVLANDTAASGNPMMAWLFAVPTHGAVALNSDGSFVYTPAVGYFGADSFTYTAIDSGVSSVATAVSIMVAPPPPPVAVADNYSTAFNTALTVAAPGVLANDSTTSGRPIAAVLGTAPVHGTLVLNANGSFVYTTTTGYVGADSFTYTANDTLASSAAVTVGLTVASAVVAAAPASIPTLSEWGVILLGTLMAAAVWVVRRR